jgi:hypothetical protein
MFAEAGQLKYNFKQDLFIYISKIALDIYDVKITVSWDYITK